MDFWNRFEKEINAIRNTLSWSTDIYEEGNKLFIKTDLPGVTKEDLDVSVTSQTLQISGKKACEERREGLRYYNRGRDCGIFTQTFSLPSEVETESVSAVLKDGVLTVSANKITKPAGTSVQIH